VCIKFGLKTENNPTKLIAHVPMAVLDRKTNIKTARASNLDFYTIRWRSGVAGKALTLRSLGRGFNSLLNKAA